VEILGSFHPHMEQRPRTWPAASRRHLDFWKNASKAAANTAAPDIKGGR